MSDDNFDVAIIGGGSAGYACALRAAQLGKNVLLVEHDQLGGTCLHNGCVPTKALLHAAEVADTVREADQFGVTASLGHIDMAGVQKYKDAITSRLFKGLTGLVASRGITVVQGDGRLVDDYRAGLGMPRTTKVVVSCIILLAVSLSAAFVDRSWVAIAILVTGAFGIGWVLFKVPTRESQVER